MRVAILCLQNVPFPQIRERARRAEALGAEAFFVADHFVNPYGPNEPWLEAWALLGALAASTERMSLGTLVSPVTLRNPAVLAAPCRRWTRSRAAGRSARSAPVGRRSTTR